MKIQRYFGMTIMVASLVMLALGSTPQSFAGTTTETSNLSASMVLGATCGVSVVGAAIDYASFQVGTTETESTTINNGGTVTATLEANAGIPSAVSGGGGFAAASDGITHINPSSIGLALGVAAGFIPLLDNGNDEVISAAFLTGSSTLNVQTTATIVNLPVADPNLSATIALTASC